MKTVVIGVGNPLLGDDGVGNHVAKMVKEGLPEGSKIDIREASSDGIQLIEEMLGYDRAIVIDAIATDCQIGTVHRLTPKQLRSTIHFTAPHCFNFASAYQFGKHFGTESMPKKVEIYGVEIEPTTSFAEGLSPLVLEAAQRLSRKIIENLTRASDE